MPAAMAIDLPIVQRPTEVADQYNRIYRYTLSLLHDATDAEDVTQETFLRAHQHRDTLRNAQAELAWLYQIATHVCLDRLRRDRDRGGRSRGTAGPAHSGAARDERLRARVRFPHLG